MRTRRRKEERRGGMGKALRTVLILVLLVRSFLPVCLGQGMEGVPSYIRSPQDIEKWLSGFTYQMKIPDAPQNVRDILSAKVGDCDDLAKVASEALAALGISSHVVVIKTEGLSIRHAICIWKDKDGHYNFFSNKRLIFTQEESMEGAIHRSFRHCEGFSILSPEELKAPAEEESVMWGFRRLF